MLENVSLKFLSVYTLYILLQSNLANLKCLEPEFFHFKLLAVKIKRSQSLNI